MIESYSSISFTECQLYILNLHLEIHWLTKVDSRSQRFSHMFFWKFYSFRFYSWIYDPFCLYYFYWRFLFFAYEYSIILTPFVENAILSLVEAFTLKSSFTVIRFESPDINPFIYGQLILTRILRQSSKEWLFNKWCWDS